MSLSMYTSSVPILVKSLNSLSAILTKAEAWAAERKIDEKALTGARLFPDMFPFSRQVQIATDTAKGAAARLAGIEVPSYADTETSFAELRQRIEKTIAFLQGIKDSQIDGSEERQIRLKAGPRELEFIGRDYLRTWVYPNFYFHVTTAYNILRHNGVPVGKLDYLGG